MRPLTAIFIAAVLFLGEAIAEEILPSAFPLSRYSHTWENSPFNREVIKVEAQVIKSSFAQTLTLEGIVDDDQIGPIAYVREITENRSLIITRVKSEEHRYVIVSASQLNNPEESTVTITDGVDKAEIGYIKSNITQPIEQAQSQTSTPGDSVNTGQLIDSVLKRPINHGEAASVSEGKLAEPEAVVESITNTPTLARPTSDVKRVRVPPPGKNK